MPAPATTVVLFGVTGDLARRKLLPGLLHLFASDLRIVGPSLEDFGTTSFREFARKTLAEFSSQPVTDEQWYAFDDRLSFVRTDAGPDALRQAIEEEAKKHCPADSRRLHYLSVPPKATRAELHEAGLVEHSRVSLEKPFGTDLASAQKLNAALHEYFDEEQIFRIDHFLSNPIS